MQPIAKAIAPLLSLLAVFSTNVCLAGRPLTVEDANINEVGAAQVETWFARQAGGTNVWVVAPAYGLMEGAEIAAALTRDAAQHLNTTTLQAKFRLTPSWLDGCNAGAIIGAAQPSDGSGNTPYFIGVLTCNTEAGSLHLNLGANRQPGEPTLRTWGLAFERQIGAMNAHVEYFGQEQEKPVIQLGLRKNLLKNVQIDGTVGHGGGASLLSIGLKYQF